MFAHIWPEVAAFLVAAALLLLIALDIIWKRRDLMRKRRGAPPADGRAQAAAAPTVQSQPKMGEARRTVRGEVAVRVCVMCWFPAELDDVAVGRGATGCVCLRCFARVTGTERPMPAALRRALVDALAELHVP